jgi:hypothetical protein
MWTLRRPSTRYAERDLVTALTRVDGQEVHLMTLAERRRILKLYKVYKSTAGRPSPALKGEELPDDFRLALYHAYGQVQENGRLSSLRARLKNAAPKCPYCGFGEIGDLDHHLPRKQYKPLSIYACNLIPCCHVCNKKKAALASPDPHEHIAHVYLDRFPKKRFLVAAIALRSSAIRVSFSVQQCSGMSAELCARLNFQIARFALEARYQREVLSFLTSQQSGIQDAARHGAPSLKTWLRRTHTSLKRSYGLNDWRTALVYALARSDEFCEGGFRYCLGFRNPGA